MSKRKKHYSYKKKLPVTKEPYESNLCMELMWRLKSKMQMQEIPKVIAIHVPNEGVRTVQTAKRLIAMGMLKGVSDYLILLRGGRVIALEMKRNEKCKLELEQELFKQECLEMQIPYLCTYKVEEALAFVAYYANQVNNCSCIL